MQSMSVFVDTNVLVYRYDQTEPAKQRIASEWLEALWRRKAGRTSTQVLHELYVTLTRKLSRGLEPSDARIIVQALEAWKPVSSDANLIHAAWELEDAHSFSFWDALIVAAALRTRSNILLTEDLHDGMTIGSLTITNPFKGGASLALIHDG
jgi:predicted nucleic acid-binding protein